jgi:hypothetical protein
VFWETDRRARDGQGEDAAIRFRDRSARVSVRFNASERVGAVWVAPLEMPLDLIAKLGSASS